MGIKAICMILENPGDAKRVKVEWKAVEPIREWYPKRKTRRCGFFRVEVGGVEPSSLGHPALGFQARLLSSRRIPAPSPRFALK
jgi:hypothetical protein